MKEKYHKITRILRMTLNCSAVVFSLIRNYTKLLVPTSSKSWVFDEYNKTHKLSSSQTVEFCYRQKFMI